MGILRLQAQRLLAAPFVLSGVETLIDPAPRAKELEPAVQQLAEQCSWFPDDPQLLVRIQGAAGVAGGALLLLGQAKRPACLLLIAQSAPTLLAEWNRARTGSEGAGDRMAVGREACKDASLIGALLLLATEPKKRPSAWRREARKQMHRAQWRAQNAGIRRKAS